MSKELESEMTRVQQLYTQSDIDLLKNRIRMARYAFIIDYPNGADGVSAHKAYTDGFNFAWSLIESALK